MYTDLYKEMMNSSFIPEDSRKLYYLLFYESQKLFADNKMKEPITYIKIKAADWYGRLEVFYYEDSHKHYPTCEWLKNFNTEKLLYPKQGVSSYLGKTSKGYKAILDVKNYILNGKEVKNGDFC